MEIILLIRCSAVARTLLSRPVMAEQRVYYPEKSLLYISL